MQFDDIFDDEFEIMQDKTEVIETNINEIDEVIDDSFVFLDNINIQNQVIDMIRSFYSDKVINSPQFLCKLQNYISLIKNSTIESNLNNEILEYFGYMPIVDFRKKIFRFSDEDTVQDKIKYSDDEIELSSIFQNLQNIQEIKDNRNSTYYEKQTRLFYYTCPFVSEKSNHPFKKDTDVHYTYEDIENDTIVNEETRILYNNDDVFDKVEIKGILNSKSISDNVVDMVTFKNELLNTEIGSTIYVSDGKKTKKSKITLIKNGIVFYEQGSFDTRNIFDNKTFISLDSKNISIQRILESKFIIMDTDDFNSIIKYFMSNVPDDETILNTNTLFKKYPLLDNKFIDKEKIKQTLSNNYKTVFKSKTSTRMFNKERRIKAYTKQPLYKTLFKDITKYNKINKIKNKEYLSEELEKIKSTNTTNTPNKLDMRKIYPKNVIVQNYNEINTKKSECILFQFRGKLYPLYKTNSDEGGNNYKYDVNKFTKDIPKGYSIDKHFNITKDKFDTTRTITSNIETTLKKQDKIEYSYTLPTFNLNPYPITYNNSKNRSHYVGDVDFIDYDNLYENSDYVEHKVSLANNTLIKQLYDEGILEQDEDIFENVIFDVGLKSEDIINSPSKILDNIIKLLQIELNDAPKHFIISYVNQKINIQNIKKDIKKFVTNISNKIALLPRDKQKIALSKLKADSEKMYDKAVKENEEHVVLLLFSLIIIFVQLQLPRIILNINAFPLCSDKANLYGYPIDDKKNGTLIGYISCIIKQLASNNVIDFGKYKFTNQSTLYEILEKYIADILEDKPFLKHYLQNTKKELSKNKTAGLTYNRNYWSTFKPSVNTNPEIIEDKQSIQFSIASINDSLNNKKKLKVDKNGKHSFANACCLTELNNANIFDNLIDEAYLKPLKVDKKKRKINTFYRKGKKDKFDRIDRPTIKQSNIQIFTDRVDTKIVQESPLDIIKDFVKENELFDNTPLLTISFNDNDYWQSLNNEIMGMSTGMGIRRGILDLITFVDNNTVMYSKLITIMNFITKTLNVELSRIYFSYKLDENNIMNKKHIPTDVRKLLVEENIKNMQGYEIDNENIQCTYKLQDLRQLLLFIDKNDDIELYKYIQLLAFILLKIISALPIEVHDNLYNKLHNQNKFTSQNIIIKSYEQQREDSKQAKIKQINTMNDDTRELYAQLKKTNLTTLMNLERVAEMTEMNSLENDHDQYFDNLIDDFQDQDDD